MKKSMVLDTVQSVRVSSKNVDLRPPVRRAGSVRYVFGVLRCHGLT